MEKIYKKAILTYGHTAQANVAIEEMSELIKCICKDLRGMGVIDKIAEEIADVEIMLGQLRIIYSIDEERIDEHKRLKLERLAKMLEG